MSFLGDLGRDIVRNIEAAVGVGQTGEMAGRVGAAAGTAAGTQGNIFTKTKEAAAQIGKPAPVSPVQAAKEALGVPAEEGGPSIVRTAVIWVVIIAVGLIGIWGLLAPGGGVALIERKLAGK